MPGNKYYERAKTILQRSARSVKSNDDTQNTINECEDTILEVAAKYPGIPFDDVPLHDKQQKMKEAEKNRENLKVEHDKKGEEFDTYLKDRNSERNQKFPNVKEYDNLNSALEEAGNDLKSINTQPILKFDDIRKDWVMDQDSRVDSEEGYQKIDMVDKYTEIQEYYDSKNLTDLQIESYYLFRRDQFAGDNFSERVARQEIGILQRFNAIYHDYDRAYSAETKSAIRLWGELQDERAAKDPNYQKVSLTDALQQKKDYYNVQGNLDGDQIKAYYSTRRLSDDMQREMDILVQFNQAMNDRVSSLNQKVATTQESIKNFPNRQQIENFDMLTDTVTNDYKVQLDDLNDRYVDAASKYSSAKENNNLYERYTTYKKANVLAEPGEYVPFGKIQENYAIIIGLRNQAVDKKKAENATDEEKRLAQEEIDAYDQAIEDLGLDHDYIRMVADGTINRNTALTLDDAKKRMDAVKGVDDFFFDVGKSTLSKGEYDTVLASYAQSGLSWEEFVKVAQFASFIDKDEPLPKIEGVDYERVQTLATEINDLEHQIGDVKGEIESGKEGEDLDDRIDILTEQWEKIRDKICEDREEKHEEVNEDTAQLIDVFSDYKYGLYGKLDPELDESLDREKLVNSDVFKRSPREQQELVLKAVFTREELEQRIADNTKDLRAQLDVKKADLEKVEAPITRMKEMANRFKLDSTEQPSTFIEYMHIRDFFAKQYQFENGQLTNAKEGQFKTTTAQDIERLKQIQVVQKSFDNYQISVYNAESAINNGIGSIFSAMNIPINESAQTDIDQAAAEEYVYKTMGYSKEAFDILTDPKIEDSDYERMQRASKIDGFGKMLGELKNQDFDVQQYQMKTVMERKQALQNKLNGKSWITKAFAAILPNSWTETGRLKNAIKTIEDNVSKNVSEQDLKDLYTDPIDQPRNMAEAAKLKPVLDYLKQTVQEAGLNAEALEDINKNIALIESGVFAKGRKDIVTELTNAAIKLGTIDGLKFEVGDGSGKTVNSAAKLQSVVNALNKYSTDKTVELQKFEDFATNVQTENKRFEVGIDENLEKQAHKDYEKRFNINNEEDIILEEEGMQDINDVKYDKQINIKNDKNAYEFSAPQNNKELVEDLEFLTTTKDFEQKVKNEIDDKGIYNEQELDKKENDLSR